MEGLPFTSPAGVDEGGPLGPPPAAFALIAADGVLVGWSREAEALLGYTAPQVLGRRAADLLVPPAGRDRPEEPRQEPGRTEPSRTESSRPEPSRPDSPLRLDGSRSAVVDVRHRGGHTLRVAVTLRPLAPAPDATGQAPSAVLMAAELEGLRWWETRQAMLQGLVTQSPVTLTIYGPGARLLWANASSVRELGGDLSASLGRSMNELFPGDLLTTEHLASPEDFVRRILDTGEPVIDVHFRGRAPADPRRERVWSSSYFRLLDGRGEPVGVCEQSIDVTDHYRAQQRLALLAEAGARIGATLDPFRTAAELVGVAVPHFADAALVDVTAEVLEGEDPGPATAGELVRAADSGGAPSRVGERVAHGAGSPQAESLAGGRATEDPVLAPTHLYVPLVVRGAPLGLVTFVRGEESEPFGDGDRAVAEELASRTAVCIDNARRYRRERTAALMLQRSLLPRSLPELSAVEAASRYLPADSHLGAGGDWFDVIALSGARVGLVVGDVVGHGLGAAATMGRLRAMVRTLAELDLAPDELLARLNDQVGRDASDESARGPDAGGAVGATCVYGIYDPASGTSTWAAAGHLPPAVVPPDGPVGFLRLPPGPPLGVGRLPYEAAEVPLAEGSQVVLFTDGLVEARGQGVDGGLERLADLLGERRAGSSDALCARIVEELVPDHVRDDATLLVVRTRALDARQVAAWELSPDPALVARARSVAAEQLGRWGLDDLAFTTELVVSELVTNAIRHASGPIGLRLIRDRSLICEVSDSQHTSPHARYAGNDEEGGRGLFMVAQLTEHWGTRYLPTGKTIWAEQALPAP
ncbi:SpoIIE family protein phosphatase [Streptomyces sp. NPDC091368]|uniref:SpoIIE family protein phosphatase n=1 Tax=Streptomyces sp. NPDC091368 TaxID=3365993 RepID=UPI00380613D4